MLGLEADDPRLSNETYLEGLTDGDKWTCEPYYTANEPSVQTGIKGLRSGVFKNNTFNKYHQAGDAISSNETSEPEYNLGGEAKRGYIITDITTAFTLLVGIFFPSCTGE